MIFKNIAFFFDEQGKVLADIEKGIAKWRPRIVTADMTKAASYGVQIDGNEICIVRQYKDLDTDPYNCDGRPPVVFTTILDGRIGLFGDRMEIVGLEYPNLCWAGLILPGYKGSAGGLIDLPKEFLLTEKLYDMRPSKGHPFRDLSLLRQKIALFN